MVSVIVLTHNNEETLERTLQSVSWCDEIVIVDDFSTDQTVEIVHKVCKVLPLVTCKIFQRKVHDNFAEQRNFGLNKAVGKWVLFVDSDEVVTPQLAQEVKQVVEIPNLKFQIPINGYYLKRRDFLFGKWLRYGETGSVKLLRLAKKGAGEWVRPVHEIWDIKGQTETLQSPLLHFPHPNVAQFLADINHYSTLNAQYLYKTNTPSHTWQILVYPKAKFLLNYVIRLGFLDGIQGLILSLLMSFHSFLTRGKLWLLRHKQKKI